MVFCEIWESHVKHLEEVFKWLQHADLKIKCSKYEFFKSKVQYLGYLIGTDGVQPLPEKVAAIPALEPPKNIKELQHFLGLIRFYRKFIPFFANVTACLNTMLQKGAVFRWTEQCNNAFNLLKSDLATMPRLQYPNPNKPFKLFMDASKHSHLGILHQEEVSDQPKVEPNLVPIAYFSGSLSKTQQLWNTTQRECYAIYQSIQNFSFYLMATKYTLYCNHKPTALFFTTGMSNPVLDHWALELQKFNIQFEHILGRKNVVADAISQLRTLGLYQDNGSDNIATTDDEVVKNVMEEVHAIGLVPNSASCNIGKLNLDVLQEEQWQDKYCIKKMKAMRTKQDHSFMLDNNSILRKVVRQRYTIDPTIVVPRKLTWLIIVEFHDGNGHQGISCTVNMIRHYFWWVGMCSDVHQHIWNCQLCIQFLPNQLYTQPMHLEILKVPFAGCAMDCIGPLPAVSKGSRHALTFMSLLTSYLITVPLKSKMADEVLMAYIKEVFPKTSSSKFILQDNCTKFKNEQLMSVFNTLGIKHIYSNPYYPQENGQIEKIHNFFKHTITMFTYSSQLKWDDEFLWLPIAITSCHQ